MGKLYANSVRVSGGVVIGILNLQSSPLLPVLPLTIKDKTDQHWEPSMKETTITSGANADAKLQPSHPARQINSQCLQKKPLGHLGMTFTQK